jgi:hypothetical protein
MEVSEVGDIWVYEKIQISDIFEPFSVSKMHMYFI